VNPVACRENLCGGSAVGEHDSSEMGLAAGPALESATKLACRTLCLWSQYLYLALCTRAKRREKNKIVDPESLAQMCPKAPRELSAWRQTRCYCS